MAFVKADRVQERSNSTGTGNIFLAGAYDGTYRTFASQMSNGDTCQVLIISENATEWEIIEGSYNSSQNSIVRDVTLSSSNSNAPVSFSSGTKRVAMLPPSSAMVVEDNNGDASIERDLTVGRDLIVNDDVTVTDDVSIGGDLSVTGSLTLVTPLPVVSGGTGATSGQAAAVTLAHAYVVETLADLQNNVIERPFCVVTRGYTTPNDGGGGVWVWYAGSVAAADNGTIVNPTGGAEVGRYFRLYSGYVDPRWFGAIGDGVTNDTTALSAALATGNAVFLDGGRWLITNVTVSAAGASLYGSGDATIVVATGSTGDAFRVNVDDFSLVGVNFEALDSPSLSTTLYITGSRYTLQRCKFYGGTWSMRAGNTLAGPQHNIAIGTGATVVEDGVLDNVYTWGGRTSILFRSGRRVQASNIQIIGAQYFGMNVGGGYPMPEFQLVNFRAISCGLYGLTNAGLFGGACIYPVAFSGWQVENAYIENCGWLTFFTGIDGSVGGGKYGMDFTDNAANNNYIKLLAKNCCAGGMESKGNTFSSFYDVSKVTSAQTSSGAILYFASTTTVYVGMAVAGANIPADTFVLSKTDTTVTISRDVTGVVALGATIDFTVSPVPEGHRNIQLDVQYLSNFDGSAFLQEAVGIYMSDATAATSFTANHDVKVYMVTESAPAWRSLLYTQVFDLTTVGGYTWMCLGTSAGEPGTTGQTSPSGAYSLVSTTTNAPTASGTTLYFASTTGMQAGMTVFAENVPDGTTVVTVNATDIVISAAVTGTVASSASVVIAQVQSDGTLYWLCLGADGAASSQNNRAVKIGPVQNATLNIDAVNTARGLLIVPTGGLDDTCRGLKATVKTRGARYGIELGGVAGDVLTDATFVACDIEGDYGFYQSSSGGTYGYDILGGRIEGTTYGFRVNNGTNAIRLDGGVYIYSPARAVYVVNGTNTVRVGAATFEGSGSVNAATVELAGGSGTWDWGQSIIQCNTPANNVAGYSISGGTMTTRGRVLRTDLSSAPASTIKAGVGEYMIVSTPTYTAGGYICTDTTGGVFRWEQLPNGTSSYGTRATKTGDFTLGALENFVINNKAGSTCVVTLPAASDFPNREVRFVNNQAQLLDSASANVVPIAGGAAGTAILAATAGRWCTIQSNGTDWMIVETG